MNIFKQRLEKFKQQQQVLAILIFSLVAVIIWIAASIFSSQKRTGIDKDLLKLAKPLTPSINREIIQRIGIKRKFTESDLQNFPIYMMVKDHEQVERIVEIGTELEPPPTIIPFSPSPSPTVTSGASLAR